MKKLICATALLVTVGVSAPGCQPSRPPEDPEIQRLRMEIKTGESLLEKSRIESLVGTTVTVRGWPLSVHRGAFGSPGGHLFLHPAAVTVTGPDRDDTLTMHVLRMGRLECRFPYQDALRQATTARRDALGRYEVEVDVTGKVEIVERIFLAHVGRVILWDCRLEVVR